MNNFVLAFRDNAELREIWEKKLNGGVAFLPTAKKFQLHEQLNLVFRIADTKKMAVIPAKVIQILSGGHKASTGMVVEYENYSLYQKDLDFLIEDLDLTQWTGIRDFSSFRNKNIKQVLDFEGLPGRFKRFLKDAPNQTFYEILQVDPACSQKDIEESFKRLNSEMDSLSGLGDLDEAVAEALGKVIERMHLAYKTLKDKKSRQNFDIQNGMLVRRRDDSLAEFEKRKILVLDAQVRKKHHEIISKAQRLYQEGLQALENDDIESALKNVRIALVYDPVNRLYRQKLQELEAKRPKRYSSQGKLDDLLQSKKRSVIRPGDVDWIEE